MCTSLINSCESGLNIIGLFIILIQLMTKILHIFEFGILILSSNGTYPLETPLLDFLSII